MQRLGLTLAVSIVVLILAHGTANILGAGAWDSAAERTAYGAVQVLAGIAIAVGLFASGRNQARSVPLVVVGVVAIAVVMPWFAIVTVPIGIGLVALTHRRRREASLSAGRPEAGVS